MTQTISDWKQEGLQALERYKTYLNKNELDREQLDDISYIEKKFGKLPEFEAAKKDNYDRRANSGWGGFGAPDCSCHISPPCQACVNWTNYCDERQAVVESKQEPGCVIVGHDCEVTRNPA